jgi:hypothetical protein
MQIFSGSNGATYAPSLSGSTQLSFEDLQDADASGATFQRSLQLSSGLTQGISYAVYAVAEDLNRPLPNRMKTRCTSTEQPLICALVDPPCIKNLQVACECIGPHEIQVSVNLGTTDPLSAPAGLKLHYMVLEAMLPSGLDKFNTSVFPVPTLAQIRLGQKPVPSAMVAASGSICVGNNDMTTFTVPDSASGLQLRPAQEYVVCVAPPSIGNATCGEPLCKTFLTLGGVVPVDCSVSGCQCEDNEGCAASITCSSTEDVLVKYRFGPSECRGVRETSCPELMLPSMPSCCPSMANPLAQMLDCCPTLAEGWMSLNGAPVTQNVSLSACGLTDVLACGVQTRCQTCPRSQICQADLPFEDAETLRRQVCKSSPVTWADDSDRSCTAVNATAAGLPPSAVIYSREIHANDLTCGQDSCSPALCQATVCEPDTPSPCNSMPSNNTIFVLGDSPGRTCCVALDYRTRIPRPFDVLQLQGLAARAPFQCAVSGAGRLWQAIEFGNQLDNDALYMVRAPVQVPLSIFSIALLSTRSKQCVCCRYTCARQVNALQAHCATNDTSGNVSPAVQSVMLTPPAITAPVCSLLRSCQEGARPQLTFSMTTPGQLAYVVVANNTCSVTLTADDIFREARRPTSLKGCVTLPLDPSYHGIVDITSPAAGAQVPMTLANDTVYTVHAAARFDEGSLPCCLAQDTSAVARYTIDPARDCLQPTCTCPSSAGLKYLQPSIQVGNGLALPAGPAQGEQVSCDSFAFTQRFILLDGDRGAQAAVSVSFGGRTPYTNPGASRQPVSASGAMLLRSPVRLRAVLQQPNFHMEDELASGPQRSGRQASYRYAISLYFIHTHHIATFQQLIQCMHARRYMLYDAFDSTAVDTSNVAVEVVIRLDRQETRLSCGVLYDSFKGGTCIVDLPIGLFSTGVTDMKMSLQILDHGGIVQARSQETSVSLHGIPVHDVPMRRSGFAYGPYRGVHEGESFSVAVFGHAAGQLARGFLLQVEFNASIVEYTGYSLASSWRVRSCSNRLR